MKLLQNIWRNNQYPSLFEKVKVAPPIRAPSAFFSRKPIRVTSRVHFHSSSTSRQNDKKLFTPGPLCVSATVKTALCRDMGSRDTEFINIIKDLRHTLVEIAKLPQEEFTSVLMQGSGTFAVESVLQSTSDREKKVLIVANGAYGKRMKTICDRANIPSDIMMFEETEPVNVDKVMKLLDASSGSFSSVAVVQCETTSGIVNPIEELANQITARHSQLTYIVDAMSSFAGMETDYTTVDFLISSANKCLQGIPGFAFVICRKHKLQNCKGRSLSLALDLYDQWRGLEDSGQFRFTPPTHAILGLRQACIELTNEGGVSGRAKRYANNCEIIQTGMATRGFKQLTSGENGAGHIITSFHYPSHPNFKFEEFYQRLSDLGQLIYPGKVTNADCFRIGHIGHLNGADMTHLLSCIDKVLQSMKIPCPLT